MEIKYYIYEVKGIKNGCTTQWDKRSEQNFKKYNIMPVIVETHEYPNTAEYWQIVGDIEWALAELNGYPKGVHYRLAMERRSIGGKIGGKICVETGQLASIRTKENQSKGGKISGRMHLESGQISSLGKASRKLTFEDAQIIREIYSPKEYSSRKLAKMYGVSQATISNIILNKRYTQP